MFLQCLLISYTSPQDSGHSNYVIYNSLFLEDNNKFILTLSFTPCSHSEKPLVIINKDLYDFFSFVLG